MQHLPVSVRVRYLDAARATMLLLGISFHISEIYRVSGGFFLDSPDRSYVASLMSGLVHSFRMRPFSCSAAISRATVYLATYFAFYPAGQELPEFVHVIGIASEGIAAGWPGGEWAGAATFQCN
jgi:hypothetical protein